MNEVNTNQQYKPMTVGEWILTFILMSIPFVGIIMMFVWAFSSRTQPSKQSWAKAYLIIVTIWMVLVFFLAGLWWFMSSSSEHDVNPELYYDEYYYDGEH